MPNLHHMTHVPDLSVITSCDYISKAETDIFLLLSMAEFTSSAIEENCSVLLLSSDTAGNKLTLYYLNKNCSWDTVCLVVQANENN